MAVSRYLQTRWQLVVACFMLFDMMNLASSSCAKQPKADYDFCVVGCGGSGGYTAVKLKQLGYRVLVLEKQDTCGGHCKTVHLPGPDGDAPVNTGVVVYENSTTVTNLFRDWNIPVSVANLGGSIEAGTVYNFYTNSPNYVVFPSPPSADQIAAFITAATKWYTMFYTYFGALLTPNAAMPDFSTMPAEIQSVLFGSFQGLLVWLATQDPDMYGVDAAGNPWWQPLFPIWTTLLNNVGPVFEVTALYALRNLQPSIMDIATKNSGFTVDGGCQTIYDRFSEFLNNDLKLNVSFTATRTKSVTGIVKVTYKQAGQAQSVRTSCRRMVVSIVQSYDNMRAIIKDLDAQEAAAFKGVTYNIYSYALFNTVAKNASNTPAVKVLDLTGKDLPTTIGMAQLRPSFSEAWRLKTSPDDTPQAVAAGMYANLTAWSAALNGEFTVPPSIDAAIYLGPVLHQHTPRAKVPQDTPALYKKLYALQGHRQLYYTGALFSFNSQSSVWTYSQWLIDTYASTWGPPC